ncbi:hypothetical protein ONZ45_g16848 [Pleurotus djamor]|nr:hypothetical protein ONZ45_g16848 [Pleurotus djamor]
MPFINNGEVALTTYNDVAGNLINVYTTSTVGPVALTALRFGKPSIAPFSKFIDLLLEAQIAFQDITPLYPHHQPIRKLGGELSSICTQTALVGLLAENMFPNTRDRSPRDFGIFSAIASRVEKYTDMIQKFVGDVRLFRDGLQFTSIGPLWRRVFWSIMWCLSSDITRIVEQALQQLVSFQRPFNLLIDTLGKNEVLHDLIIPAQSKSIFEQFLANRSEVVHHFATHRARLNLFKNGYSWDGQNYGFVRSTTYEIDICLEYFSSFSDLQSLVKTSSYTPLDKVDLVDVSNHRLITAETSELLAASTSSLEIQTIYKAFYISSKPMTKQCPRCDSLCNGPVIHNAIYIYVTKTTNTLGPIPSRGSHTLFLEIPNMLTGYTSPPNPCLEALK